MIATIRDTDSDNKNWRYW